MHDPYKALYLHIPFCARRCKYCDFETAAVLTDDAQIDDYIDDLCLQIRRWAKAGELSQVETIYIGGGTPSFIGCARLTKLLYMISVSIRLENVREFTLEANPESINEALIKDIWALGVNRLSIGVQSFDDEILTLLGRVHTAKQASDAILCAQTRFSNISVDLMCGIPGQSIESLQDSIQTAIQHKVTHVSMYPLTIERHTPLDAMVMSGEFPQTNDDEQALHMECAERMLSEAGFLRYEVANYARSGYESIHNCAYWTGIPYLGIGKSAATMTQNSERRGRMVDGQVTDDLDRCQMLAETVMLQMRLSKGVSEEYIDSVKDDLPEIYEAFNDLEKLGYVEHTDGRYRPTHQGWLCGNDLYGRIFDLAP